jgi:FtsP/CotA-like multicopper oxidase with cupredoxin domain
MIRAPAVPARRANRRTSVAALAGVAARRWSDPAVALAAIALGTVGPVAWPFAAKAQPQQPAQVFELRIEGGELAGGLATVQVTQGDSVRLRFTADAPTILHLHGYDIEQEAAPGRVAEMHFEAYAAGRFPVEIHTPGDASDHSGHDAPLLVLEVYPR